ncbi:hypothetical protein ABZ897_15820 [Nonomuraea sp. NPDC046802]|uniref:hypothetical protein n=1 Tax=Nonomuraea sp. NPDC046802 TaxID=3154919 RepID=UPI0033CBAE37
MNFIFYAHLLGLLHENPSRSVPAGPADMLTAPAAVLEIRITNERSRDVGTPPV